MIIRFQYVRWLYIFYLFVSVASAQSPLRVGIVGDQTGTYDLKSSYGIFEKGVEILAQQHIDLAFHTGDMIESTQSTEECSALFYRAANIMDQLNKPWYMIAGDHDVNPPQFIPCSSDRSREKQFMELYGERVPQARERLYYSVDRGGYHFIILNSQENLHVDPRWGNIFLARISDTQFQWLSRDLEEHRDAKGIVVFLHQPLWYNWSAWMRVHELLRSYPVITVLAGHFHYDQDCGTIDDIRYLIVGTTGGSIKKGHRDAGNQHHVTVMTLTAGHAQFELLPIDSELPMDFTPRIEMDRIQALEQTLGELWNFENQNGVYLKNGMLIQSCDSLIPARISLTPIGNPVDVPIRLKISFSSDQVRLTSPHFDDIDESKVTNAFECQLSPGERVIISNLSSVMIGNQVKTLWSSGIKINGENPPLLGSPLKFIIRLSYHNGCGELYVEKEVVTHIQACQDE